MFIESAILLAYAVTIVSEEVIILAIQQPSKIWQWIIAALLANSLTHPLAIYFLRVQNAPYILVELGVLIVEMLWYKLAFKLNWRRALIISGAANIFSIFSGFAIRLLFSL